MKRVLYLTNIEVPYRVRFFNLLARHCDLTVLYERKQSANRDPDWASGEPCRYHRKYLNGIKLKDESSFSLGILREVTSGYDNIIVGCCNSPSQIAAMCLMRIMGIPYLLNVDGEIFLTENTLKTRLKYFFLRGAREYLAAGEKSAASLVPAAQGRPVTPYYFSSLDRRELALHSAAAKKRGDTVLVVGQYLPYKGLDVALEAARMDPSTPYKFVGMGNRTERFHREQTIPDNVELIPFLQKADLEKEYQTCAMLVLPSRQECWGLVINEAASFGTPIVSTWGSGAAVEFLSEQYPQYLATPGDARSLSRAIHALRAEADLSGYCRFLKEKSSGYSIEASVDAHCKRIHGGDGS